MSRETARHIHFAHTQAHPGEGAFTSHFPPLAPQDHVLSCTAPAHQGVRDPNAFPQVKDTAYPRAQGRVQGSWGYAVPLLVMLSLYAPPHSHETGMQPCGRRGVH